MSDLVYCPAQVVSYDFDLEQVTAVMLEVGINREEVWPLLSITKTNLEKVLRKFRRGDLLDLVMPTARTKVTERIDFRKANP